MLIVRSPVRISFGGGGTDFPAYYEKYGGAVLSTSINKYFYTIVSRRQDSKIQVISSDLRLMETWQDLTQMNVRGHELEIPLAVMKELGSNIAVNLFLASEIPPGTGLGSSASVCVNILKALSAYLHLPCSNYELAEKAFHVTRTVLGRPVGKQDEYAAAFGGLNLISFQRDGNTTVQPLGLASDLLRELQTNLMLFFTGAARNSWNILKDQEQSTQSGSTTIVNSLHSIRELATQMGDALTKGDLNGFGDLLDEGWQAKKKVSSKISSSQIDGLYQLARDNGARGGKITGAGGGGFLLLYCAQQYQDRIRKAFSQVGVRELTFEFEQDGARVLVNDPFLDNDSRCGLRWSFVAASSAGA